MIIFHKMEDSWLYKYLLYIFEINLKFEYIGLSNKMFKIYAMKFIITSIYLSTSYKFTEIKILQLKTSKYKF